MIIKYLAFNIGVVGVSIIIWGALLSIVSLIRLEIMHVRGKNICRRREIVRLHFGTYILLGLEFLIAADIMDTIIKPDLQEVAILGSIVAIRTVLSFFLNRELKEHACDMLSSGTGK